jgi:asparagine N-glycosylation enzyme membrane subunit Stt3
MSKELVIILLGILVALMPYLGFPGSWKTVFSIVIGIVIAGVAFIVRQERLWKERETPSEHRADTFVENGGRQAGS